MSDKDNDLAKIKKLIKIMKDNDLCEVEIKHGDDKILLKRSQPQIVTAMPMAGAAIAGVPADADMGQAVSAAAKEDDGLIEIKSPMVGTYYGTPSPDSEPFIEIGSRIEHQTLICIIEAMKVMNEIKAEISGTVAQILVTSGQAIEFGQVLFKIKPD